MQSSFAFLAYAIATGSVIAYAIAGTYADSLATIAAIL